VTEADPGRWALFDAVDPGQARAVLSVALRRRFGRGEALVREGDSGQVLHLIDVGHVAVRVVTPLGEVATLRLLGPGEYFGELSVVSPGRRNATIVAIDPTKTLAIERAQFDQLRAANPAVDRVLLQAVVQEVRRLSSQLVEVMYLPVPNRVVRRLCEVAGQFPEATGPTVIPLTQEDLAGLCGATRPTVNKVLQDLQDQGLIEVGRGRVAITDLGGLRRRATAS